jgi:hypothetical protein
VLGPTDIPLSTIASLSIKHQEEDKGKENREIRHKYLIAKSLTDLGYVIIMTGDVASGLFLHYKQQRYV